MEEKLLEWMQRLDYRPSDGALPTPEDMSHLCRGDMRKMWEHLMENVLPVERVTSMRGNLKLQKLLRSSSEEKVKSLRKTKMTKLAHLHQLGEKIKATRNEIGALSRDISKTEAKLSLCREECSDLRQRKILYDTYRTKTENKTQRLRRYGHSLNKLVPVSSKLHWFFKISFHLEIGKLRRNGIYPSTPEIQKQKRTPIYRIVPRERESALKLEQSARKTDRHNAKMAIGSRLEAEATPEKQRVVFEEESWSPDSFLQALTEDADSRAKRLDDEASKVDPKSEIENLRLNYSDKKNPEKLLSEAVAMLQEIVRNRRRNHVARFMETEEAKNEIHRLISESRSSTSNLPASKTQQLRVQNEELKAQIRYLKDKIHLLSKEQRHLLENKRQAHDTYMQLKGFAHTRQVYFTQIRQFIEASKAIESEVGVLRSTVRTFCDEKISRPMETVIAMQKELKSMHQEEIEAFAPLRLNTALRRTLNWRAKEGGGCSSDKLMEMAAAGCHVERFEVLPKPIQPLLAQIGFPVLWGSPCRLVAHTQRHLDALEGAETTAKMLLEQLELMDDELQRQPEEYANGVLRRIGTVPQAYSDERARLETAVDKIRKVLEAKIPFAFKNLHYYVEQPSQHVVPWKKVHGKNLEEWMASMTGANARLQELLRSRK
eukprot:jgi/Bigna1/68396/fgenesh1_pg.6_\